jgi:hypothetical protein
MPTERGEIQAKRDEIAKGGKCQRCFQNQAHQGVGVSLHHRILAHAMVAASLRDPLSTASNFDKSFHEAGECQDFSFIFSSFSLSASFISSFSQLFPLSQAASVATLPSALLVERLSLGARVCT